MTEWKRDWWKKDPDASIYHSDPPPSYPPPVEQTDYVNEYAIFYYPFSKNAITYQYIQYNPKINVYININGAKIIERSKTTKLKFNKSL